jgi:hypothetical protein
MIKQMRDLAAAIILGLGTWSGAAAQEPLPAPTAAPDAPAVVQPCADAATGGGRFAERRAAVHGAVHAHYNRHGYCCAEDPAIPGCPSLCSELTFIFGSCRTFFMEPCLPHPPKPARTRLIDRMRGISNGSDNGGCSTCPRR